MASYYVARKSGSPGWRLMETVYTSGVRKPKQIPTTAYRELGFRVDMSVAEAKLRASQLNKQNKIHKSKVIAIARRVELESVVKSAFIPQHLAEEFVEQIKIRNVGSETHLEKRLSHWKFVQNMITELRLEPKEYVDNAVAIYKYMYAPERRLSLDYCAKIRRMLNEWGYFVSRKNGQFFEPIETPKGKLRRAIADANRKSNGRRRKSEPLTEELLNSMRSGLPTGQAEYLEIALFFGLRPEEILALRERPHEHKIVKINGVDCLRVFQSKLTLPDEEECWKVIPAILPQQKLALNHVRSGQWNRPLAKTLQRVSGIYLTRYCGRKGFHGLMRNYGQDPIEISKWLGHQTLNRTFKDYTDKQEVRFNEPPKKTRKAS